MAEIPEKLKSILKDLNEKGWVIVLETYGTLYLIGGVIRDAFLNRPVKDLDFVVEGIPLAKIQKLLKPFGKVNIVGESFSVLKFYPNGTKDEIDISIPRIDRKIGVGHKGFEVITDGITIEQDLKRRDFTINAMAVNVKTGKLINPFDGITALKKKLLMAVNPNTFIEDPLRILRGIQFASRFDFDISYSTLRLMRENAYLIKEISGERILEELMKILTKEGNTQRALSLIHKTGVDKALFDKKMLHYEEGFEHLDPISFFYVLGLLGDVDPAEFYKTRLRGEAKLTNDIDSLNKFITLWTRMTEIEEKRYLLFKLYAKSPDVFDAVVLPPDADIEILKMRRGEIPMKMSDIQLNGDDILLISKRDLKGPEVGLYLEKIQRDALMNKFNWKDRHDSINYLVNLIG